MTATMARREFNNDNENDANGNGNGLFLSQRQPLGCSKVQSPTRITTATTSTSVCRFLLLTATLVSSANAQRTIESSKSVGFTTTAWVLASVSTLVSVLAMVFVIVYRSDKIVTVGQPVFLCLICFGALLMSISLYFDAGAIEEIPDIKWSTLDNLCVLQLWCMYCGMLIVLVALICKLWRAEKVCQFRKGRKILVQHVIWPFAAIVVIEFSLMMAATIHCPPTWQEILLNPFVEGNNPFVAGSNSTSTGEIIVTDSSDDMLPKCFFNPMPAVVALRASSHALIVLSQIVVIWMAYQTRKIPEEVVDTKRVYYLMVCWFCLYIPFLLLEYGVIPSGRVYYYFDLIFPFLFSIAAVCFLVGPKVYYLFYYKRHGNLPASIRSSIVAPSNKVHVSGVGPKFKAAAAAATASRPSRNSVMINPDSATSRTESTKSSEHKRKPALSHNTRQCSAFN